MQNTMKNDTEIEDEAIDYFLDETIDPEAQQYLMDILGNDPKLGEIFETLVLRAVEVSDEGLIEGAGTGTSDSIPARLSDGEFVFTAKAVEAIGVEVLEDMMARAEAGSLETGSPVGPDQSRESTPRSLLG